MGRRAQERQAGGSVVPCTACCMRAAARCQRGEGQRCEKGSARALVGCVQRARYAQEQAARLVWFADGAFRLPSSVTACFCTATL